MIRDAIMRRDDVLKVFPGSVATLYRAIKAGHFPKPRKVSKASKNTFWLESDIKEWLKSTAATV
jgi:predicted DNA-binding transcriptional regulator AlpA